MDLSLQDLNALSNTDMANDTLESYQGYEYWQDHKDGLDTSSGLQSMFFTRSEGQAFKQGFMYGFFLGIPALHARIVNMFVYGADADLINKLSMARDVHNYMSLKVLCETAAGCGYKLDFTERIGDVEINFWVGLKK